MGESFHNTCSSVDVSYVMSQNGHRVEAGIGDGTIPFVRRWTGVDDSLLPVDSLVSSTERLDRPPLSETAAASSNIRVTFEMPFE
jgi:hypothetical protein